MTTKSVDVERFAALLPMIETWCDDLFALEEEVQRVVQTGTLCPVTTPTLAQLVRVWRDMGTIMRTAVRGFCLTRAPKMLPLLDELTSLAQSVPSGF